MLNRAGRSELEALIRSGIERGSVGELMVIGCLARRASRMGNRLNTSIRRVFKKIRRGVEAGDKSGVLEIGAENGYWAMTSPRIGLETERSGRVQYRTDSRRCSTAKRRCRPGTLTSQWWRKRRCERAKGRIEFGAPAGCSVR